MMYLITHPNLPLIVIKADTVEEAQEIFHTEFQIRPMTLELLDQVTEEEFTIVNDAGF